MLEVWEGEGKRQTYSLTKCGREFRERILVSGRFEYVCYNFYVYFDENSIILANVLKARPCMS